MRNKLKLAGLIIAAVFWTAACAPGPIPVVIADMDGFDTPLYIPADNNSSVSSNWGSLSMRVNHEGLTIKHSYKTSDDVIHIVLTGKIANGIPQGLLWNNIPSGIPDNLGGGTVFGAAQSVSYSGLGDYRIGTVGAGGNLSKDAAGSVVVALGSPDFSSEWVMAAPYSAVVISGLVDAGAKNLTIIETNDSLNLLSVAYRNGALTANNDTVFTTSAGKLRKRTNYTYDPNQFDMPYGGTMRRSRGGYGFLISEKANPRTASFEIEYNQSGKKKRFEVDYSAVEMRPEVKIDLTDTGFQTPTPATVSGDGYILTLDTNITNYVSYSVSDVVAGSIAVYNSQPPTKPLYLRPFYTPANIDPNKAATNMIKEIYLADDNGRRLSKSEIGDLVLKWDDEVQAITLTIEKYDSGNVIFLTPVVITAILREPYYNVSDLVYGLTCSVYIIE